MLLISACSGNPEKDSSVETIVPESETNANAEETEIRATAHFSVAEDLSLDNSVIIDLPSDKLAESVAAKLQGKGKFLNTINEDGSVYIIGTASTGVPVNSSGFISSRNIAFAKAEMRAKAELLRLSGEVITSERNSALVSNNIQGSDPDADQKASFIEKAAAVVDKSLDKALQELGVSDGEVAKMNQSQKEKRYSEDFYNYVSSYVASMIKGVSVIKIAEGEVGSNDYEVAVCVKYSPEQQSEAAGLKQLGASQEVINSTTVKNIQALATDKLMSKLGAQFFKDENGNKFILGFGQSAVQKSDNRQSSFITIGRRKARLQAIENIKNLVSEDLVGKEISESIEKISEFQDGEQSLYTEDNFSELIKSKRSSLKLNTMKIRDWQGNHPVSKSMVVGTIVILTKSNDVDFNSSNLEENKLKKTEKSEYHVSEDIEGEDW